MRELMKMLRFLRASLTIQVTVFLSFAQEHILCTLVESGFDHYALLQKELGTTTGVGIRREKREKFIGLLLKSFSLGKSCLNERGQVDIVGLWFLKVEKERHLQGWGVAIKLVSFIIYYSFAEWLSIGTHGILKLRSEEPHVANRNKLFIREQLIISWPSVAKLTEDFWGVPLPEKRKSCYSPNTNTIFLFLTFPLAYTLTVL